MITPLPQPIAAYMQAINARDTAALLACFTADAVVTDEGQEYHGAAQIREWREQTEAQYHYTVAFTDVREAGNETVVTAQVAGTFAGSPIQLPYHFTLTGDKITALHI